MIGLRLGLSLGSTSVGGEYTPPANTAPDAFTSGQWGLAAGEDKLSVTISSLPANGGAAITDIQYRVDGGTWTSSGGTVGFDITGLINGTEYAVEIRAVNSVDPGPSSDVKSATPADPVAYSITINDFSRDKVVYDHGGARQLAVKQSVEGLLTRAGAIEANVTKTWGVDSAPAGLSASSGIITWDTDTLGTLEGWDLSPAGATSLRITGTGLAGPAGIAVIEDVKLVSDVTDGSVSTDMLIQIDSGAANIFMNRVTAECPDMPVVAFGDGYRRAFDMQYVTGGAMPDNITIQNSRFVNGMIDPVGLAGSNIVFQDNLVWQRGNVPAGVLPYDETETYDTGEWVTNSGGYYCRAKVDGLTGPSGTPPSGTTSDANWLIISPHADAGTVTQFDGMIIRRCYTYMWPADGAESTGENNAWRIVPNTGTHPIQEGLELYECVLNKRANDGLTIQYVGRDNAVGSPIIRDNWMTANSGGQYLYALEAGDTVVWQNNRDYYTNEVVEEGNGSTIYGLSSFNGAEVPVSGTATADEVVQARVVDESAATVVDWFDIATADGAGDWSGVVECDLNLDWLTVDVRLKNSTGTTDSTTNTFGVGISPLLSEQSNKDVWGFGNSTGNIETIGSNGDNFQYFRIINRGSVSGSDESSTIEGPIFVTDANPVNNAMAAMAAYFHKNYPGLKVQWLFDVKPGVSEDATLNDDDTRRDFDSLTKLRAAALGDGQKIGIKTFTHYDTIDSTKLAEYLAGSYIGKDLNGDDLAGVDPDDAFADVSVGGKTINHIWAEAFPELRDGDAPILPMIEGALWSNGSYPNAGDNWRTQERLLASSLPINFLPHVEHTITSKGGIAGNDNTHLNIAGLYGFQNSFRAIATAVGRAYGLTPFQLPMIDNALWTTDYVEVWSSQGPITTIERAEATDEARSAVNYPSDPVGAPSTPGDVEVFGFTQSDQVSEVTRTEIVAYDGSGTPANSGRIRIYPESGDFSATSRIYHMLGRASLTGLTIEDANLDICRHMPILDVGLAGQTIEHGWPLQPLDDVEFINNQNDIETAGADTTTYTDETHSYDTPNLTGSKLTLEMAMNRDVNSGDWDVVKGTDGTSFYYQVYISVTSPSISFKFDNNSGTEFNGRVNLTSGYLDIVDGIVPRIRVVVDSASSAQYVRLFVDDVELTASSPEVVSTSGDLFGVAAAAITTAGSFHGGTGMRFFDATGYNVAYFRAWTAVQADGGTDTLGAPWVEAVSDGAGDFTVTNLT